MHHWETTLLPCGTVVAKFSNPPMNYFTADAAGELAILIEKWKSPGVKAVVLTGGPAGQFITHYSVEELAAFGSDPVQMDEIGTGLSTGYHSLLRSLRALPKPIVAAITGDCMGGGLELALWCDLRIVERGDYRIGLPEIHMGIMPGGSGTQMLTRIVGAATALKLVMLGKLLTPDEALEHGIVQFTSSDALAYALRITERLCGANPLALANIKSAIYGGAEGSFDDGLESEAAAFLAVVGTPRARDSMHEYLAVDQHERVRWLSRDA